MSAVRDALRRQLLERLHEAWDTDGVGTLDVGRHYVQWAKYTGGLQVECVSNAFLEGDERLGFVQRRRLDVLGFHRPQAEWPNHYARFESESDLPAAADLLVRAIEEVLDVDVLEGELPQRGNVCVVVPVGKCFLEPLEALLPPMIAASEARRPTVVIDAFGLSSLSRRDTRPLERWLMEPDTDELPTSLSMTFTGGDIGRLLTQAAALARACEQLRARGAHVIVLGPRYLPLDLWLYNGVVTGLADGLVAVSNADDLRAWHRELGELFNGGIRYSVLAGYGSDEMTFEGARWSITVDESRFHVETAAALGLHGIANGFTDHDPFD